ncbi:C-C motif chemokine 16 [Tupaia chinensis]|uniref:C-C motif chemokine 16 n=1 Tax=Tupaia chinensis TaxID=246437 RepID=L9KKQ7_TUPCH|nr:C-C motif chemokine 16 [Tupaia chinensis]ELW61732.1 C-C motif chemokine 16 [Tupaia chinensis]
MKVSVATLFLLIIILATTPALYGQSRIPESVNLSSYCCVKYQEKVLPRKLVVGYRKALSCHWPAIIFVTKKNREVCTNPNNNWVQEYIKDPNLPLLPPKKLAQAKSIRSRKGQP